MALANCKLISCGKKEDGDNKETETDFKKMPLEEVKALVDEGDLAAMTELSYRLQVSRYRKRDLTG